MITTHNAETGAVHSPMLAAALDYAANGWAVFPCSPRTGAYDNYKGEPIEAKAPLTDHGWKDASKDPELIRLWWAAWPDALIGARVPDALLVIDIDPRNGGSLTALEEVTGPLPATLTVWSGGNDGGHHLYFLRPAGELTSTRLPEGIDLKTSSGYCIMPPSIHPATGQPYRWGDHVGIAPMPGSLRAVLRAPARPPIPTTSNGSGAGLVRTVRDAKPGERHDVLVWACFRAREGGILDNIAGELVRASVSSGHDETDARRVVESVRRA